MKITLKIILFLSLLCGCLNTYIASLVVNLPGDTYSCGTYNNSQNFTFNFTITFSNPEDNCFISICRNDSACYAQTNITTTTLNNMLMQRYTTPLPYQTIYFQLSSWSTFLTPYTILIDDNVNVVNFTSVVTSNRNMSVHLVNVNTICQNARVQISDYTKINSFNYFAPSQFPITDINSGATSLPSNSSSLPINLTQTGQYAFIVVSNYQSVTTVKIVETVTINLICFVFTINCSAVVNSTGQNVFVGNDEQCVCNSGSNWDMLSSSCYYHPSQTPSTSNSTPSTNGTLNSYDAIVIGLSVSLGVITLIMFIVIVLLIRRRQNKQSQGLPFQPETIVVKPYS